MRLDKAKASYKRTVKKIKIKLENCGQGSISPKFYEQLLHVQIPKEQKDIDYLTGFLCFCDLHV